MGGVLPIAILLLLQQQEQVGVLVKIAGCLENVGDVNIITVLRILIEFEGNWGNGTPSIIIQFSRLIFKFNAALHYGRGRRLLLVEGWVKHGHRARQMLLRLCCRRDLGNAVQQLVAPLQQALPFLVLLHLRSLRIGL